MIKQETDGTYTVSYSKRHPTTRKPKSLRRKGIKTKAEAQRVYTKLVLEVSKAHDNKGSAKMVWRDLLQEYFQSLVDRDLHPATIYGHQSCLNAHTLERWGNRGIGDITNSEILNLLKKDLGDKSTSHRKSMRKFLNGAFSFALSKRYITNNPVPFVQFRHEHKLKPVLKESEAIKLLAKAKEYNHPWLNIWTMALYTGMRSEELYALKWKDVNLENDLIHVNEVWTKKGGFKAKLKNGEDRLIEIAPPLKREIIKWKGLDDSMFVLPRLAEWDSGRQAEILRVFLLGINLPMVNFHALRATWATILLSKGVEPIKVMRLGGWRDLKTLTRHYIRLSGVDIKGATSALNFSK